MCDLYTHKHTHTPMGGFIKDTVVKVMALQHLTENETEWGKYRNQLED